MYHEKVMCMGSCRPFNGSLYTESEKATDSGLLQSNFRTEVDGKKTDLYILRNKNNMEVGITNFGGRIVSVMVPDKDGQMRDVVLGSILFRTISASLRISVPLSDVMPIVSIRDSSLWIV